MVFGLLFYILLRCFWYLCYFAVFSILLRVCLILLVVCVVVLRFGGGFVITGFGGGCLYDCAVTGFLCWLVGFVVALR